MKGRPQRLIRRNTVSIHHVYKPTPLLLHTLISFIFKSSLFLITLLSRSAVTQEGSSSGLGGAGLLVYSALVWWSGLLWCGRLLRYIVLYFVLLYCARSTLL